MSVILGLNPHLSTVTLNSVATWDERPSPRLRGAVSRQALPATFP